MLRLAFFVALVVMVIIGTNDVYLGVGFFCIRCVEVLSRLFGPSHAS